MIKRLLTGTALTVTLAALALASCSESKDVIDENFARTAHTVKGKVEKGPLVRGSQIDMRTLDKTMVPTGESYTTTIENNTGDFNYGSLKINSPYAKLTADGYFYNEVEGVLSNGTIRLDALVDLSDNTTVNVNVLTHLKSQRINHLVTTEGKSFKEANEQAQKELLSQFGLQAYATKDASQFSITSGDDAAGALIAVSSLIISDRSEAEIVEYLSMLSNEFSTTGAFSNKTKERLKSTQNYLNGKLETIENNIKTRYQELGYDVTVKDLAYYFDWDGDGVAGNELEDADTVKLSQNKIEVPAEGGEFTVRVESDKPYYLTPPSTSTSSDTGTTEENPGITITPEQYLSGLYEAGTEAAPESEKKVSIESNVIKIQVGPTQSRASKQWTVSVYNARGAVAAEISLTQQGDQHVKINTPLLGESGKTVVSTVCSAMRDAVKYERSLEWEYALSDNKQAYSDNNTDVTNCWSKFYSAINNLLSIKQADAEALNCYQPYVNTHIALNYYLLSSHWGGLPFFLKRKTTDEYNQTPRTSESEILATLSSLLEEALPDLEEKKNDSFTDGNSAFFVSKDVARILLAYVYCNQEKWDSALPLLEKVISNGFYSLTERYTTQYKNDSECILAFRLASRSGITIDNEEDCLPCLDYKDVLLTVAECLVHTGNETQAKEYVNSVQQKKNLTTNSSDVLTSIAELKQQLRCPNFLTFIRRNGLGTQFMKLNDSQTYQLLWPIPYSEYLFNPFMTQNPGY